MKRYYRIAGLKVEMDTYGRLQGQAIPYEIEMDGVPDICIHADLQEAHERFPTLSDEECEYMATGRNFYLQLLNFDGLKMHSSAVVLDGKAYLFSAPCGTGKSTHASLWRRVFGDERVRIINDDKPALRFVDGVWYVYGTPWSGKTGQNLNIRAPLAGIAMIERGEENKIVPYTGKEAIAAVYMQITRANDINLQLKSLELLDKLLKRVPIWKLHCNMDPEAAMVSYEAMRPKCD